MPLPKFWIWSRLAVREFVGQFLGEFLGEFLGKLCKSFTNPPQAYCDAGTTAMSQAMMCARAVAARIYKLMHYDNLDDIVWTTPGGDTVDDLMVEALHESERRSKSKNQSTKTRRFETKSYAQRAEASASSTEKGMLGPVKVGPVKAPAPVSKKWKDMLASELDALPEQVHRNRFRRLDRSPYIWRSSNTFIILHVNSGTSGTTSALRQIPECLGSMYGDDITVYIFLVDAQPVYARTAMAGVRPDLASASSDSKIKVEVFHLTDHRAAVDSRDVRGVLTNFFRLLKVLGLPRRLDFFIVDGCCSRWAHNEENTSLYTVAVELSIQIMVTVYLIFLRLNDCSPLAFHQEQVEYACAQISEVAGWPEVWRHEFLGWCVRVSRLSF